jgi:cysteine desulfurase
MEAYLDNSATTRCMNEAVEIMIKAMECDYGNPSSMHMYGVNAEKYIKEAKETFARILKCQEKEIIFTSGGTESNNMAIIGTAMANKRNGKHVIVSSVEHSSVKEPMRFLEEEGFRITCLPVDKNGLITLDDLKNELCDDTILVSTMFVNNEIGAVEPIEEMAKMIHAYNPDIVFHVDAIQAFGKYRIYPKKMGIDLLSVSGHKIHGPKGTGILYIRDKVKVRPLILGGGQQKAMRSGTENVPGIAGLGVAAKIVYTNFEEKIDYLYHIKELLEEGMKTIPGITINGKTGRDSAPHILSVSFEGVRSEVLLHALEDRKIYVSSGSACASNKPALSSTLVAIGVDQNLLDSTIRFSLCFDTTKEEIEYCIQTLKELLPMLRKFVRS